jgi:hypothetical protein
MPKVKTADENKQRIKRKPAEMMLPLSRELQLECFIPVSEAARMQAMSEDTFRKENADKIVDLSDRRQGIRLRDVLKL